MRPEAGRSTTSLRAAAAFEHASSSKDLSSCVALPRVRPPRCTGCAFLFARPHCSERALACAKEDIMPAPTTGRFVWHELHSSDRPKAAKFYKQLFGWEMKDVPMGPGEPYTLCQRDGKDFAGITKSMAPPNVPSHWLPYIGVDNVDASAAKIKELGGKTLM